MTASGAVRELPLPVDTLQVVVSALVLVPPKARWSCVLAHGAGAGMRHHFMEAMAHRLAQRGVATLRYQFPYMEEGRRRPDVPRVLHETVRAAVSMARDTFPDLPLVAGGKSLGGRMTSQAQANASLPGVRGLVFVGFPLHAPKRPDTTRAAHLEKVRVPMLFLQGTRDALAQLDYVRPVCQRLDPRATLHIVEGGDHSFNVLKRSGRSRDEVLDEMADMMTHWLARVG